VATYRPDPWAAIADDTRRSILERLARGPASVGNLAENLPVSRPAVSQHLKVLKQAGLVAHHAEGTRRIYHLDATGLAQLRSELDHYWERALVNFKSIAEESSGAIT
jgi:DNA-binding transcriptional ArsR family regulator